MDQLAIQCFLCQGRLIIFQGGSPSNDAHQARTQPLIICSEALCKHLPARVVQPILKSVPGLTSPSIYLGKAIPAWL